MPILERTVEIAASPSTVWSLFTTQEGLRQWWAPDLEIDVKVGGKHRHYVAEVDQWISGYVLEIVPEQVLVCSWFEEDCSWRFPVRVTFTLEPIPGGTRVTQRYDGFAGIGTSTWEKTVEAYRRGMEAHDLPGHLKRAAEALHAA